MSGSAVDIKPFGRAGRSRAARGMGIVAATVACLLAVPAPAQAAGLDPTDRQLSAAQQAANSAGRQVGQITAQIAVAQSQVTRAQAVANIALGKFERRQADYETAQASAQRADEAAALARDSYIQGSTSAGYAAVLTSDGPQQMLERNALLAAANGHRTDVFTQMTSAANRADAATRAAAAARDAAATMT